MKGLVLLTGVVGTGNAGRCRGRLDRGLKELPPVGLMLFSVGVTDGAVVVSVVLDGAGFSSLPPQAVSAPMEMKAATPRPAATRRVRRLFMIESYLCYLECAGDT